MKTSLLTLVFLFIATFTFGYSVHQKTDTPDVLLIKVKNVLEKHLVGTKIRDLKTKFEIKNISSLTLYEIKGDIVDMLPLSRLKLINHSLNKAIKNHDKLALEGSIYFDKYLDSALVEVAYQQTDTIYHFYPISIPLEPREGYPNFSKELHDLIKLKFKEGKISKEDILSINSISFNVNLSGVITGNHNGHFKKELDSFFNAKKWKRSAYSSNFVEVQVEFNLNKDYILKNSNWQTLGSYTKGYSKYESDWANLDLITPFKTGSQLTFFSAEKPVKDWECTSIVSVVYDKTLGKYRMPIIHFGNREQTKQLIEDLMNVSNSNKENLSNANKRIYFYRKNN